VLLFKYTFSQILLKLLIVNSKYNSPNTYFLIAFHFISYFSRWKLLHFPTWMFSLCVFICVLNCKLVPFLVFVLRIHCWCPSLSPCPSQLSTFHLSPFLHVASPAAFVIFLPLFLSARESCESISVYLARFLPLSPLPSFFLLLLCLKLSAISFIISACSYVPNGWEITQITVEIVYLCRGDWWAEIKLIYKWYQLENSVHVRGN